MTTLVDCGCETTAYKDGSGVEIHYCPLHEVAPDLLKAIKDLLAYGGLTGSQEIAVEALIAKAEGRS